MAASPQARMHERRPGTAQCCRSVSNALSKGHVSMWNGEDGCLGHSDGGNRWSRTGRLKQQTSFPTKPEAESPARSDGRPPPGCRWRTACRDLAWQTEGLEVSSLVT